MQTAEDSLLFTLPPSLVTLKACSRDTDPLAHSCTDAHLLAGVLSYTYRAEDYQSGMGVRIHSGETHPGTEPLVSVISCVLTVRRFRMQVSSSLPLRESICAFAKWRENEPGRCLSETTLFRATLKLRVDHRSAVRPRRRLVDRSLYTDEPTFKPVCFFL